jgi:hypothetical protein
VVRIRLAQGDDYVLRVGGIATNTGRWAIPGSRWAVREDDGELFAIAPWTADWATSKRSRFEGGA